MNKAEIVKTSAKIIQEIKLEQEKNRKLIKWLNSKTYFKDLRSLKERIIHD